MAKFPTNIKLNIKTNFQALNYLKKHLSQDDISAIRRDYMLVDLFFRMSDFDVQSPTLLYLLSRSKVVRETGCLSDSIEFKFDKEKVIFGPVEFALMSGLSFGGDAPSTVPMSSTLRGVLRNILDKPTKCATLKISDFNEALKKLSSEGDVDKVRMVAVLYLVYTIVFGKETKAAVDDKFVHLVEKPDLFNAYPWGKVIYEDFVYDFSKARTLMLSHLKNLKKSGGKKEATIRKPCMIHIFPYALQGWFLEGISREMSSLVAGMRGEDFPRLTRWRTVVVDAYKEAKEHIFKKKSITFTQMTPHADEIAAAYYTSAKEHTMRRGNWELDGHGDDDDDEHDEDDDGDDDEDDASSRSPYASKIKYEVQDLRHQLIELRKEIKENGKIQKEEFFHQLDLLKEDMEEKIGFEKDKLLVHELKEFQGDMEDKMERNKDEVIKLVHDSLVKVTKRMTEEISKKVEAAVECVVGRMQGERVERVNEELGDEKVAKEVKDKVEEIVEVKVDAKVEENVEAKIEEKVEELVVVKDKGKVEVKVDVVVEENVKTKDEEKVEELVVVKDNEKVEELVEVKDNEKVEELVEVKDRPKVSDGVATTIDACGEGFIMGEPIGKRKRKAGHLTQSPYTTERDRKARKLGSKQKQVLPVPDSEPGRDHCCDSHKLAQVKLVVASKEKKKFSLVTSFVPCLTSESLKLLLGCGTGWVTSEHTDALMELLNRQLQAFPTCFGEHRRWTCLSSYFSSYMVSGFKKTMEIQKQLKAENKDPWGFKWSELVPDLYKIVGGAHKGCRKSRKWSEVDHVYGIVSLKSKHWCTYDIDLRNNVISVFDSAIGIEKGFRNGLFKGWSYIIPSLWNAYADSTTKKDPGTRFEVNIVESCPQQNNGSDCGIFAMKFAQSLAMNAGVQTVITSYMQEYRYKIALDLLLWKNEPATLVEEFGDDA